MPSAQHLISKWRGKKCEGIGKMKGPCLFAYATSELSQDAFFAYLFAWSDDQYDGCPEHALGRAFLAKIFGLNGKTMPEKIKIKVYRQCDHMDIFCEINGKDFALIFEDKVSSLEHGDQLKRYWETTNGYGYRDDSILGIYCKTHELSYLPSDSRYHVMDRQALLDLLGSTVGQAACHTNRVIDEFKSHLYQIDNLVNGYKQMPTDGRSDWDGLSWTGNFTALQKKLNDGNWNYVANASGGFMGFWWHWRNVDGGNVYLQLEEGRACFKVEVGEVEKAQELKYGWNKKIIEAGKRVGNANVRVICPNRMRVGSYMTVAILERDYRCWDGGKLNLEATIENLRTMEKILDEAVGFKQHTLAFAQSSGNDMA